MIEYVCNADPEELILSQSGCTFQGYHLKLYIPHLTNWGAIVTTLEVLVRSNAETKYLKQGLPYIPYYIFQLFPLL